MESLVSKLEKINKTYLTFKDIQMVSKQKSDVLKVSVFNLIKQGKLLRLKKGFYILGTQNLNLEKIGQQLYSPSYLSCEYALGKYGILNQKPYTYTFITSRKTKNLLIANQSISYQQIKKELFFGFENIDGVLLASKEKALLDELYLVSWGRNILDFDELNLKDVSLPEFLKIAKKYPKRINNLVEKIIPYFGKNSITIK